MYKMRQFQVDLAVHSHFSRTLCTLVNTQRSTDEYAYHLTAVWSISASCAIAQSYPDKASLGSSRLVARRFVASDSSMTCAWFTNSANIRRVDSSCRSKLHKKQHAKLYRFSFFP